MKIKFLYHLTKREERLTGLLEESFATMLRNPAGRIFGKKDIVGRKGKNKRRSWGDGN